jgi:hypothetical protein
VVSAARLCECGCGLPTRIETRARRKEGYARGQAKRFMKGHNTRMPERERLFSKVEKTEDGCWAWTGTRSWNGYGTLKFRGRWTNAHRAAYLLERGSIPDGLQIDHLCRNRACVNVAHMEAVTQRENILRGVSPAARQAHQTHCKAGHRLPEDRNSQGRRHCKACFNSWQRESRRKKAVAL